MKKNNRNSRVKLRKDSQSIRKSVLGICAVLVLLVSVVSVGSINLYSMKTEKSETAVKYFLEGANCAQAVLCAFAGECGISVDFAMRLASGFGAGIARRREVCGAVSGMALTLGLFSGSSDPSDKAGKMENYAHVQAVCEDFRQMNGSIICRELLALSENPEAAKDVIPANVSERTPQFYKKRPCSELVYEAAGIVAAKMEELKNASVHG